MFIVNFVEYLKALLKNCLFVLKTEVNLYILSNVFGNRKIVFNCVLSAMQQGCNWN